MSAAAARTRTTTINSQIRPIAHIISGIVQSIALNRVLAIRWAGSILQALVHHEHAGSAVSTRMISAVVSECEL
jgi:hypothetical protein